MQYLSTTEIAKQWNISPRRVAKLASEGRIEGAITVGNNWMIPDTAARPEDGRKKNDHTDCDDRYVFPNLIYGISSKDDLNELPSDEKLLLDGIVQFGKTEYAKCICTLNKLLQNTDRLCLKIGSHFYLALAYIAELQFDKASEAIDMCRKEIDSADHHQNELLLINNELDGILYGVSDVSVPMEIDIEACYSKGFLPYLAEENAYSDACSLFTDAPRNTVVPHEIICMYLEERGYYYAAINIHSSLAMLYSFFFNEKKRDLHLIKAVDLALKHENYSILSFYLGFNPGGLSVIKKYYPEETIDILIKTSVKWLKTYPAFLKYYTNSSTLLKFTEHDYLLLFFARTGYSIQQIAEEENLSISTVKKQLHKLYKKMDVQNKKELVEKYNRDVLEKKPD